MTCGANVYLMLVAKHHGGHSYSKVYLSFTGRFPSLVDRVPTDVTQRLVDTAPKTGAGQSVFPSLGASSERKEGTEDPSYWYVSALAGGPLPAQSQAYPVTTAPESSLAHYISI